MKILFCTYSYYPNKDGVQNVTQYQAEGLAELGHEVTVITSDHNYKEKNEIYNGVKIIRIDAHTDNMMDFGNKDEYQRLVIEQSKRNDIIICVCPETWSTDWVIPIQEDIKCKKVILLHGMYEFDFSNIRFAIYPIIKKIIGNVRWGIFYKNNIKNIRNFDAFIHTFGMYSGKK